MSNEDIRQMSPRRSWMRIMERIFYWAALMGAILLVGATLLAVNRVLAAATLIVAAVSLLVLVILELSGWNLKWIEPPLHRLLPPRLVRIVIRIFQAPIDSLFNYRDRVPPRYGAGIAAIFCLGFLIWLELSTPDHQIIIYTWPLLILPLLKVVETSRYGERISAAYLLFGALIATVIGLVAGIPWEGESLDLTGPFIIGGWIFGSAAAVLFIIRRSHYYLAREELIQSLSLKLASYEEPADNLPELTKMISSHLSMGIVTVLTPDSNKEKLMVRACTPLEPDSWIGFSVPLGKSESITAKAFNRQESQLVDDVDRVEYFARPEHPDFQGIRSELAVPIIWKNVIYGVLDFQSPTYGAFSEGDRYAMEYLARTLGIALARDELARNFQEMVDSILEYAESEDGEARIFQRIRDGAKRMLGADLIVFYRLAPGTGFPIVPPRISGNFNNSRAILDKPPTKSLLHHIKEWKFRYKSFDLSRAENGGHSSSQSFWQREEVASMCFIPLGTKSTRVAALYLNWRDPQLFHASKQLEILAFAHAIIPSLLRLRHLWQIEHGFTRPQITAHSVEKRYRLGKAELRRRVTEIERRIGSNGETEQAAKLLQELTTDLINLFGEAKLSEPSFPMRESRPLETAMARFVSLARQLYDLDINYHFDTAVTKEGPEIGLVLYLLIEEALNNAAVHGKANFARAIVKRHPSSWVLEIHDNGCDFDVDHCRKMRRSKYGIFELEQLVTIQLNASFEWQNPKLGPRIKVSFPALPIS